MSNHAHDLLGFSVPYVGTIVEDDDLRDDPPKEEVQPNAENQREIRASKSNEPATVSTLRTKQASVTIDPPGHEDLAESETEQDIWKTLNETDPEILTSNAFEEEEEAVNEEEEEDEMEYRDEPEIFNETADSPYLKWSNYEWIYSCTSTEEGNELIFTVSSKHSFLEPADDMDEDYIPKEEPEGIRFLDKEDPDGFMPVGEEEALIGNDVHQKRDEDEKRSSGEKDTLVSNAARVTNKLNTEKHNVDNGESGKREEPPSKMENQKSNEVLDATTARDEPYESVLDMVKRIRAEQCQTPAQKELADMVNRIRAEQGLTTAQMDHPAVGRDPSPAQVRREQSSVTSLRATQCQTPAQKELADMVNRIRAEQGQTTAQKDHHADGRDPSPAQLQTEQSSVTSFVKLSDQPYLIKVHSEDNVVKNVNVIGVLEPKLKIGHDAIYIKANAVKTVLKKSDELKTALEENKLVKKVRISEPNKTGKENEVIPEASKVIPELLDEMSLGEWSSFSMEAFGMQPLPQVWSNPDLLEMCHIKDETLWKRYYDSRRLLADICLDAEKRDAINDTDEYLQDLKKAFRGKWKATVLGAIMSRHTYQRATRVTKNKEGELRQATIVSVVFSPYLLARAVQLCLQYHREEQSFKCKFRIQFVNINNYKNGADLMDYWRPCPNDMWEFCSNSYLDMPTDEIGWMDIENVETTYFTPNMVRKIRKWLFGHFRSYHLFHDMDLLRYLFGSCGAVHDFNIFQGDIGYTWKANAEHSKDMQTYGTIPDDVVNAAVQYGTTWLEFQCRLATGSLRPVDQWYENYNQRYYKGMWGAKVIRHRYEVHGYKERDRELRDSPWKMWDLSERGLVPIFTQNNTNNVVGSLPMERIPQAVSLEFF